MVMMSRATTGDVMLTCAVMTSHVNKDHVIDDLNCTWLMEGDEIPPLDRRHIVWPAIGSQWQLTISPPTGASDLSRKLIM